MSNKLQYMNKLLVKGKFVIFLICRLFRQISLSLILVFAIDKKVILMSLSDVIQTIISKMQ
jgi:hypothetical protein